MRAEGALSPLTFEQLVALGSLLLAVVTIGLTIRRDGATEDERHAARVAEQQVMTDKLDSIADMSKETRDTVREMSKQLSEHSRELARIETRIEEHDRRLSAIEGRCDLHRTAGTD
jgi:chromosome segregation ATPase